MKQLSIVFFAILLAMGITSSQSKKQPVDKASSTRIDTTVIRVPTMVCNTCVKTITKALNKVKGVKATNVNLDKKTATVTFVSSRVNVATLERAISNAGYDANSVKRNPAAYEKLDACCKSDSK